MLNKNSQTYYLYQLFFSVYSGVKVSEYFIIGFFLENHILNFNLKLKVSFMKTKTLLWPHDEKSLKEEMFDLLFVIVK